MRETTGTEVRVPTGYECGVLILKAYDTSGNAGRYRVLKSF